jgi:tetratricopeptide (TPR) repeat protein
LQVLSTAYLNNGDEEKALHALDSAHNLSKKRSKELDELFYYNNYFSYSMRINNLDDAKKALEQMQDILQNNNINDQMRSVFQLLYLRKIYFLKIANDDYDGCEDFFKVDYENAKTELERVASKYTLGQIYLAQGQNKEAIEAFTYVVSNGGATYYQIKATEYLKNLNVSEAFVVPRDINDNQLAMTFFTKGQKVLFYLYLSLIIIITCLICISVFNDENRPRGFNHFFQRESNLVFYPTIYEAAMSNSDSLINKSEIIDRIEDETTVVVLHEFESNWRYFHLTFFRKRLDNSTVYYAYLTTNWVKSINLSENSNAPSYYLPLDVFINLESMMYNRSFLHSELERFPLFGIVNDEKIFDLTINNQIADKIIELGVNELNEPLFFFYFADVTFVERELALDFE